MRRLALLLAIAALLALPAAADALIQVQQGIAGARLNNTQAQVRAALGKPARRIVRNTELGRVTIFRYRGGLNVSFFAGPRVTQVETTGLGDRTASGVGVGSTERQVRRGVRGVRCRTEFGVRSCQVGRNLPGKRVTEFFLRRGRVSRVVVGFVID